MDLWEQDLEKLRCSMCQLQEELRLAKKQVADLKYLLNELCPLSEALIEVDKAVYKQVINECI